MRPPSGSGSGRETLSTFTSLKFLTILARKRDNVVFATLSPKHFRLPAKINHLEKKNIGFSMLSDFGNTRALDANPSFASKQLGNFYVGAKTFRGRKMKS